MTGWQLPSKHADFPRDYFLPSAWNNYRGCRRAELPRAMKFALQGRVIADLKVWDQRFNCRVAQFWAAIFSPGPPQRQDTRKEDQDILESWSANGSDVYALLAKQRITCMQNAVARSFQHRDRPRSDCRGRDVQGLPRLHDETGK